MGLFKFIIDANVKLSRSVDAMLPMFLRRDGNNTFIAEVLPRSVDFGDLVYDVGGGSRPFITVHDKNRLGLTVVGFDIDPAELGAAPLGLYDRTVVADLCDFEGVSEADVTICQATLEHVKDTSAAVRALASTIKPGGRIYIFAPSRNALFARLNRILPERLKRKLLFFFFPEKAKGHDGFKAYYDRCSPSEIEQLAVANDLVVEERFLFWTSSYFFVFTPAFLVWRVCQAVNYMILGTNAAETFIYVLRKPSDISSARSGAGAGEE